MRAGDRGMRWAWRLRRLFRLFLACVAAPPALAGQVVTLGWDRNPDPNTTGYFLYYGYATGDYPYRLWAGNMTEITIEGLQEQTTAYFEVSAMNVAGLESDRSPELALVLPATGDVTGVLRFGSTTFEVDETIEFARLTVRRVGGRKGAVTVDYATVDGTATAGADYVSEAGVLRWDDGDMAEKSLLVPILNDFEMEGDETVDLVLSNPTGGAELGRVSRAALTIADAGAYVVAKGLGYAQANAGLATLAAGPGAYRFIAVAEPDCAGGATDAVLRVPGTGLEKAMAHDQGRLGIEERFNTKAALDAAFRGGTYTLTLEHAPHASRAAVIYLGGDAYPPAPHIANWSDAQTVDAHMPFAIRWDAIPGATTNDHLRLQIEDASGRTVLSTPGFLEASAMNGTEDEYTIEARRLQDDVPYTARLLYFKRTGLAAKSQPGAVGVAGYFRETSFGLRTLPPAPPEGRIHFSAREYRAPEDAGSVLVDLVRAGGSQGEVSVEVKLRAGTAKPGLDYVDKSTTLVMGDGVTNSQFTIDLLDDYLLEGDESFIITLSNATGGAVIGPWPEAVFTILDNERTEAGVFQFSAVGYTFAESAPVAMLTVVRTGGSAREVHVNFLTENGSATAGRDFVGTNGTLSFAPGQARIALPIRLLDDTLDETNETFVVQLIQTDGGGALGRNSASVVTIADNDLAGVINFSSATYSVSEAGGAATITVTRAGGSASEVSVDYWTADAIARAGVDYTATGGTLTFGLNEVRKTFAVLINADTVAQGDRSLNLRLGNAGGGGRLGGVASAVLNIQDDEVGLRFEKPVFAVNEATPLALITVVRTGPTVPCAVSFATADGTAMEGQDYRGTNGGLFFPAGISSRMFGVRLTNDTLVEPDETVLLQLSSPSNALLGALPTAVLLITNNDLGGVFGFTTDKFSASEAALYAVVTVTRSGGIASGVSVEISTADGAATAGGDYFGTNAVLEFKAGEVSKTFRIGLINDTLDEPDETVRLMLSQPTGGASLGPRAEATLTIADDDNAGILSFSAPTYSVSETSTVAVITVNRSRGAASAVTVDYAVIGGSATVDLDYQATAGRLTFDAKVTSQTFVVPVLADLLPEGKETVLLQLRNATGRALLSPASNAVLTINDDEVPVEGLYKVVGGETTSGCRPPITNAAIAFSGELWLTNQVGNNFEGLALLFNTTFGGVEELTLTGRVDGAGRLNGTYVIDLERQGAFSGSYGNNQLRISLTGQTAGPPCRQAGSLSGSRYAPLTNGWAPRYLADRTMQVAVTSGTGGFATNGEYLLQFGAGGNGYEILPLPALSPVGDGRFAYTKLTPNTGNLLRHEARDGRPPLTSLVTLTFTSATNGTFTVRGYGGPGSQGGRFMLQP